MNKIFNIIENIIKAEDFVDFFKRNFFINFISIAECTVCTNSINNIDSDQSSYISIPVSYQMEYLQIENFINEKLSTIQQKELKSYCSSCETKTKIDWLKQCPELPQILVIHPIQDPESKTFWNCVPDKIKLNFEGKLVIYQLSTIQIHRKGHYFAIWYQNSECIYFDDNFIFSKSKMQLNSEEKPYLLFYEKEIG